MLGQEFKVTRSDRCAGKTYLFLSLLLGFAAFVTWQHALPKEEPATDMAVLPTMATAPSTIMAPKVWQLPQAKQFSPQLRAPLKSQAEPESAYPVANVEREQGRRGLLSGFAAAAAGVASTQAHQSANAANTGAAVFEKGTKKNKNEDGASIGQRLFIFTPVVGAVGWVLFNILGPAADQASEMGAKAAEREAKGGKR